MDLLSQYKQDHPESFREKKPQPMTDEYGRTYGGMIAWVIRLSGGRIRDANTASYVLFAVCAVVALITVYLFVSAFRGNAPTPLPYEQTYHPSR